MIPAAPQEPRPGMADRWQAALFVAAVALLPFDALPAPLFIATKASLYPAALGAALWLAGGGWRTPTPMEKRLWITAGLFAAWACCSTVWNGLGHMPPALAAKAAARAAAPLAAFFGAAAWVAGAFRGRPQEVFRLLRQGVLVSFAVAGGYALVEIGYLLGCDPCTNILAALGPLFRKVGSSHGWWPPLLWPDRLRSITAEPSHFGLYMAVVLPVLAGDLLAGRRGLARWLLPAYGLALLVLTFSKTAWLLALFQAALLAALLRAFPLRPRGAGGPGAMAALLLAAAMTAPLASATLAADVVIAPENGPAEVREALPEPERAMTDLRHGSNLSRMSIIEAEVAMMRERPFLGFGYHQTHPHYFDHLPPMAWDVPEVWQWLDAYWQAPDTAYIPSLNAYTRIGAESGLPGLGLFLAAFLPPLALAWRRLRAAADPGLAAVWLGLAGLLFGWLAADRFVSAAPYLLLGALVAMTGSPAQAAAGRA